MAACGCSVSESSAPDLSRFDIKKDLEAAQKEHIKQLVLPSLLKDEDSSLDSGPVSDGDQVDPTLRIKQALESSKSVQREMEAEKRHEESWGLKVFYHHDTKRGG